MELKMESNGLHVLRAIHAPEPLSLNAVQGWGDSYSRMPEKIFFLDEKWLMERCRYLKMTEEDTKDILQAASIIQSNPALSAYLWHTYYRLIADYHDGAPPADFYTYPMPEYHLGEKAKVFMLIAAVGATENILAKYRSFQIPEEVISATVSGAVSGAATAYRNNNGVAGISTQAFAWMRLNLAGRLLHLGRFEYKLKETNSFGVLLRNRKTGKKVLLCEPGFTINAKGICVIAKDLHGDAINDPLLNRKVFTTSIEKTRKGWKGYIAHPAGYVLPGLVELADEDWETLIEPGDIMMDLHIPYGGGMTLEKAKDSFSYAFDFFSRHFPNKFKPAFISHSWIFNSQLEEYIPNGNLTKFMRELYLYPAPSIGQDGFFFIFGKYFRKEELADAPRDTSIRRLLLDIAAKTPLRTGGMIYHMEDFPEFGTQLYRRKFPF